MQRRGQPPRGTKVAALSVGAKEMQDRISSKLPGYPRATTEIQKIRAAAHRHMLAVIDHLSAGAIDIRARPATQLAPGFEELDAAAAFCQRDGGGQSRQASADDRDAARARGSGFRVQDYLQSK